MKLKQTSLALLAAGATLAPLTFSLPAPAAPTTPGAAISGGPKLRTVAASAASGTYLVATRTLTSADVGRRVTVRVATKRTEGTLDCASVKLAVPGGGDVRDRRLSGCYSGTARLATTVAASMVGKQLQLTGRVQLTAASATLATRVSIGSSMAIGRVTVGPATSTPPPTAPVPSADRAVYIAPSGSGTTCTVAAPCSIATAFTKGKQDYKFLPGQYRLTSPITLTAANAGSTLEAADPTKATVIDGSMQVGGFTAYGSQGIMRASIPKGAVARALFINDVPAQLASMKASEAFGTLTMNREAGTYTTSKSTAGLGSSAELQWSGPGTSNVAWELWVDRKADVTATGANTLAVGQQAWSNLDPWGAQGISTPSTVANTLLALKAPGQFVVDSAQGYLYYWPRSGENLNATAVSLPVSQGLLKADGVDGVTVKGLRFTKDAYTPGLQGFADGQATVHTVDKSATARGRDEMTPAAVDFRNSHKTTLEGLAVDLTGAAAVNLIGKSSDNILKNSYIRYTGGSAVQVGGISSEESDNQRNVVTQNYIDQTGMRYHGGVGLFGGYLRDSTFSHNTLKRTNYSGISFGWGWGTSSTMAGNKVQYNKITDSMNSEVQDGGGIYLNGTTSAARRSVISNNVIDGDHQPHGGIYLDGSASNWDVHHNIVTNVVSGTAWLFVQSIGDQVAHGNHIWTNYVQNAWVNNNNYGYETAPTDNPVTDTRVGADPYSIDSGAQAIATSAGQK